MSTLARKVAATPARLATNAWQRIIDLLAPTNASARSELAGVVGVASLLITEETMKSSPIIASGDGPRVRVYCVYGDDAIEGSKVSEAAIAGSPVDQDEGWKISLPCGSDDLEWVRASLKKRSAWITARDVSETQLPEEAGDENARSANAVTINVESFLRP
jgi:hypothetical protein